jgi:uncharacterized protein (PEP-CTERM system associated)
MASMASNRNSKFALLLALSLPAVASAADWKFTPTFSASERYSDNITLSSNDRESSFVTELRPGFSFSRKGARLRANVDYGLQGLLYTHDSGANTVNNQLSARLNSELIEENLFLDATARIGQQSRNLTGRSGVGNYNTSGNVGETRSFSLSPSWRSRFGNTARLDARWNLTYTDTDSSGFSGSTGNNLNVGLSSGSAFNQMPWGLDYRVSHSDASGAGNRNSSLSGNLGYAFTPKTRLNLSVGRDDNNGRTAGFNRAGGNWWNLGASWAPTSRTSFNASAGKRFGGDSYGLNLSHRTRNTTWGLRYSESLLDSFQQATSTLGVNNYECTSAGQTQIFPALQGSDFDNVLQNAVNCTFIDPLNFNQYPQANLIDEFDHAFILDTTILSKSWSGMVSYRTGKSTFSGTLQRSEREFLAAATKTTDEQYSLSGSWSLRLGPRTSSHLSLSVRHAESGLSESDDWTVGWALTRRLAADATGVLELRRVQRDSGSSTGGYAENSIAARLNMSF